MREHRAEPFGLMGGIRCAGCDETWPCEVTTLRAENERLRAMHQDMCGVAGRLVEALEYYACPGYGTCGMDKLKDGTCIRASLGSCGDTAFRALADQQHGDKP